MRVSILALATPVATALAQDSPPPPPGPDAAVRTVKGSWTNFEEDGAPAAGISDAEASQLGRIARAGQGPAKHMLLSDPLLR